MKRPKRERRIVLTGRRQRGYIRYNDDRRFDEEPRQCEAAEYDGTRCVKAADGSGLCLKHQQIDEEQRQAADARFDIAWAFDVRGKC